MSGIVNQTFVTGTELLSVNLTEMLIREVASVVIVAFADVASGRPALKHNNKNHTWILKLIKPKPKHLLCKIK